MNNQRRRFIRRIISIGSGILVFLGILAGLGYETQFYNHYNPFYNGQLMFGFALLFFILRNYMKDKKETTTMVAFVETSGLSDAYDILPSEEDSTHIKYTDENGETMSIKKTNPILLPTDDGYERIFWVPKKGRKTLNPRALVEKYARSYTNEQLKLFESLYKKYGNPNTQSLKSIIESKGIILTDEEKELILSIPEMEALNPEVINQDLTEQDEPDTLFEEFTHHVAEIRRAVQDLLGAKPSITTLFLYGGVGALAMLILMILGHADFSRVGG